MKRRHRNYKRAMRYFRESICPRAGLHILFEDCAGCEHLNRSKGEFISIQRCIHPMHPRYISGIEDYVLRDL